MRFSASNLKLIKPGLAISGIRKLMQRERREDLMPSLKEAYFVMIFI
ncbi:hypothetical protein SEEU8388_14476 [Salmonella enterica subsp. enterica serovar Muenchen str. ATCC 8388]|nr:hypothetical protein SEEMU129_17060 [Salmonella enterica subsp. enterica serovar Muenchen str. RKS4129]ESF07753.1 hypothetical protein SEEU8388_14476 [Salmonella enterica subsp. enterica serovar Muenchen str. ATCC 8388]ESG76014.1 hypothetical protein SEEM1594_03119 [Salmonella enterica subsp. enterica serovar Muenchen str. baa1594]